MKIFKNEFKVRLTCNKTAEYSINKVLLPFMSTIQTREISVYLAWKTIHSKKVIEADWHKYQLILFNIIQNAVKYNNQKGVILIVLDCKCINHEAIISPENMSLIINKNELNKK